MQDDEKIFDSEPIDVDQRVVNEIDKKKRPLKAVFKFVKKNRLVLIIAFVAIIIVAAVYLFLPEISINSTKLANINTEVVLKKGETLSLKSGGNVSVEIVNFVNNTCPKGQTCFWSGEAVQYSMTIDGQKYATGSITKAVGAKFDIETIDSDYETYAKIKIIKVD